MLARLELRRFASEDGDELLDVPGGPLPDPDMPAPAELPADLGRDAAGPRAPHRASCPRSTGRSVFSIKTPHSFPTFLVDGAVAGTWRYENGGSGCEPFAPLDAATAARAAREAERLAAFHA